MQALEGIRVVELGEGITVPFAGKQFGDFGADVIKVEPPRGDEARTWGPFPDDRPNPETSASFLFFNRNKRGVTLDLGVPSGQQIALELAATADLVISDLPLSTLRAIGLDVRSLGDRHPGIVVASVTPFGEDGPYSDFEATELVADAIGGPVNVSGVPEWPPLSKPFHLVAAQVGNHMGTAALAAVMASGRSGEAQELEVSATDVLVTSFDRRATCLISYQMTGDTISRPFGSDRAGVLPRGQHRCADGYVEIATGPRWVPRMLAVLADPTVDRYFAEHPDFALRPETAVVIEPALQRFLEAHTRAECFEVALLQHGWPVYPVNEPIDILSDEHFTGRNTFVEFDHPVAGTQRYLGPPWRMAEGGFEARRAAPTLGQHNEEIYAGELGMSMGDLARARSLGVI